MQTNEDQIGELIKTRLLTLRNVKGEPIKMYHIDMKNPCLLSMSELRNPHVQLHRNSIFDEVELLALMHERAKEEREQLKSSSFFEHVTTIFNSFKTELCNEIDRLHREFNEGHSVKSKAIDFFEDFGNGKYNDDACIKEELLHLMYYLSTPLQEVEEMKKRLTNLETHLKSVKETTLEMIGQWINQLKIPSGFKSISKLPQELKTKFCFAGRGISLSPKPESDRALMMNALGVMQYRNSHGEIMWEQVCHEGISSTTNCITFNPNGLSFARSNWHLKIVEVLDVNANLLLTIPLMNPPHIIQWASPQLLAMGLSEGIMKLFNVEQNAEVGHWKPYSQAISSFAINDTFVYCGDGSGNAFSINYKTSALCWSQDNYHHSWINSWAWSPEFTYLASSSNDKMVAVLDHAKHQKIWERSLENMVPGIFWSPKNNYILAYTKETRMVFVLRPMTGDILYQKQLVPTAIFTIAIKWEKNEMWLGEEDGTLSIFKIK